MIIASFVFYSGAPSGTTSDLRKEVRTSNYQDEFGLLNRNYSLKGLITGIQLVTH